MVETKPIGIALGEYLNTDSLYELKPVDKLSHVNFWQHVDST
jgi:hypothetical protein